MIRRNIPRDNGFGEIRQILKEIAISQKRRDVEIDELRESQKRTDEQLKKTDEQLKKTDEQLNKTDAEIDKLIESQKKTDKQVGNLTDGWGKFVEGLVEPSVFQLFTQFDIDISRTYQRVRTRLNGRELEIDILCEGKKKGKEVVLAVEVKSSLGIRDIKNYLKRLDEFFEFFPKYRGESLIGIVSGIRLSKGAVEFAESKGLYILAPSGETMVILNKKGFKPRIWR
ncbi:MAG: DUF3782 domain-containing protein [Candidatus Edwardsbacteria bacterium]